MIIAFMGNDGSGKTSVMRGLMALLNEMGQQKILYVPGYDHFFLDKLKLIYQKITGTDVVKLQREYSSKETKKKNILFRIWPFFVYLDCLCLLIKYHAKFNQIILFDRYFYDYINSFQELGISNVVIERLFLMLPLPKNAFVFDASPEVAYMRKKSDHDGDIGYYKRQRSRYLELARNKNIQIINTDTRSLSETIQHVLSILDNVAK